MSLVVGCKECAKLLDSAVGTCLLLNANETMAFFVVNHLQVVFLLVQNVDCKAFVWPRERQLSSKQSLKLGDSTGYSPLS